ncbi:23S rRNA (guanosine(2251)-2'-O)-methyltransferase RlmB [Congregibacter sp.]|uniref:23S rRNA (guanosine(2251)-2'-O)-methyltransferase RlmB n=1 Tax=Congregibacter sp. TaxID=2744308 RepID=UPI003F6AB277
MATEYAFGLHAVEELLRRQPKSVSRLWLQKGRDDGRMQALLVLASNADVPISRLPRGKLDELVSGRHQGVVAELGENTAGQSDLRWSEAQLQQALSDEPQALVLVLDGVTDPHNLGACLRSADAAGVTAVIVPKDNAADITAVVRKVACGATETVPLVRVTNLARSLDTLKAAGVWIYGTAGEVGVSLYSTEFSGPVALVMGAEGAGMRRLTRERCDFLISLPMAGAVSSLNVSVATGVCLFEIRRQRLLADGASGL